MSEITADFKETFEDINQCEENTREKVQIAYQLNLIEDQGRGILNPKALLTRAELDRILVQLKERFATVEFQWGEEEPEPEPEPKDEKHGHKRRGEEEQSSEEESGQDAGSAAEPEDGTEAESGTEPQPGSDEASETQQNEESENEEAE